MASASFRVVKVMRSPHVICYGIFDRLSQFADLLWRYTVVEQRKFPAIVDVSDLFVSHGRPMIELCHEVLDVLLGQGHSLILLEGFRVHGVVGGFDRWLGSMR